jgi:hypothetical protein
MTRATVAAVDLDRSRIEVGSRPALAALRPTVRIDGGSFRFVAPDHLVGELRLVVRSTVTEHERGKTAVRIPEWLLGEGTACTVDVEATTDEADDGDRGPSRPPRWATRFWLPLEGRRMLLHGESRCTPVTGPGAGDDRPNQGDGGDRVDVAGSSLCDPRLLGFALPPLITYALSVRWHLRLELA